MIHRIESHALMDEVSAWDPWPIGGRGPAVARQLDGLGEVAEASGPMLSWRMSDAVAVMEFMRREQGVPARTSGMDLVPGRGGPPAGQRSSRARSRS